MSRHETVPSHLIFPWFAFYLLTSGLQSLWRPHRQRSFFYLYPLHQSQSLAWNGAQDRHFEWVENDVYSGYQLLGNQNHQTGVSFESIHEKSKQHLVIKSEKCVCSEGKAHAELSWGRRSEAEVAHRLSCLIFSSSKIQRWPILLLWENYPI